MKQTSRNYFIKVAFIAGLAVGAPATMALSYFTDFSLDEKVKRILEGKAAEEVEKNFSEDSELLQSLADYYRYMRHILFEEGSPGVQVGTPPWLFTSEEWVRETKVADQILAQNLAEVVTTVQQLRQQDIDVLIALVPDKSRIIADQTSHQRDLHMLERYDRIRLTLLRKGIFTPDLRPALQNLPPGQAFFRQDTHWTPIGAGAVARSLAREVAWHNPGLIFQSHYKLVGWQNQHHQGDLGKFLPESQRLKPELSKLPQIAVLSKNDTSTDTLLGENPSRIVLMGTSFSANKRWAFADHLRLSLQSDVLNIAEEGQGVFLPIRQLLGENYFARIKPELLIWEIPERYLSRKEGK